MNEKENVVVMPIPRPANEYEATLAVFERALRDPNMDITRVKEFYELQRTVRSDKAREEFNQAMSAAQGEMGVVRRDASNPSTKSRYASFAALDRALRPTYTKHGFALTYDTGESPEGWVVVKCLVTCAGHERWYHVDVVADGKGAKGGDVMTKTHAIGSALTYGRRYLLTMIFNIATSDDDGNAAGGTQIISQEQYDTIEQRRQALAVSESVFCRVMKIDDIRSLPASKFGEAMSNFDALEARRKAAAKK